MYVVATCMSVLTSRVLRCVFYELNFSSLRLDSLHDFNSSSATSYNINGDKQSSVVWPQVGYKVKDLVQQQSQYDPWIQKSKNNMYSSLRQQEQSLYIICSTGKGLDALTWVYSEAGVYCSTV